MWLHVHHHQTIYSVMLKFSIAVRQSFTETFDMLIVSCSMICKSSQISSPHTMIEFLFFSIFLTGITELVFFKRSPFICELHLFQLSYVSDFLKK